MKTPEYPIRKVRDSYASKFEQDPDVPIIDVIRHGSARGTQGEPIKHNNLDTSASDFQLDEKHLDLTERGISEITSSIQELCKRMDKKSEAVLIVRSPAWRTHSSALIAENVLRQNGVNILNTQSEIRLFNAIDQMWTHEKKVAIKNYGNDSSEIQAKHSEEIGQKVRESENTGFQRFLRHMNNIYKYLSPETLQKLKGKKLRIITFAHAETTGDFILQSVENPSHQSKGQILEIKPQSQLRAGKKVVTDVKLYRTRPTDEEDNQIIRGFKPKKKD